MKEKAGKQKAPEILCLIVYLFFIVYITLLSRTSTLAISSRLIPFWSYTSKEHLAQVAMNIALFVPLGYFLISVYSKLNRKYLLTFFTALLVSFAVELLQFATFRGMFDVDDLISNVLGAMIGALLWREFHWEKRLAIVLLASGLIGCVMTVMLSQRVTINPGITNQFDFDITSLCIENDSLLLTGDCYLYDRETPDYKILFGNKAVSTEIEGTHFKAAGQSPDHNIELQVKFKGSRPMPTGIRINVSEQDLEYVSGDIPSVDGVPDTAVLKVYNKEYDVLVYQDGDRLLWLIGTEVDWNTEIICHCYTRESEKLPEYNVSHYFDNRGFRAGKDKAGNELDRIGRYRVFERKLPVEFKVTAVVVGFNTDGKLTWADNFRVNDFPAA